MLVLEWAQPEDNMVDDEWGIPTEINEKYRQVADEGSTPLEYPFDHIVKHVGKVVSRSKSYYSMDARHKTAQ